MIKRSRLSQTGFTLVELAIVLAVTGVLVGGLYRLMSGGNQQVRDTSVAQQQMQLVSAVKGYLASSNGQSLLGEAVTAGNPNFLLPLPTNNSSNGNCKAALAAQELGFDTVKKYLPAFCDYLPSGLSSGTVNAYGQGYSILVETGQVPAGAPANTAPSTYTFLTEAANGDVISDSEGGRISTQIGNDGGFIYANSPCGGGGWACGTYGAWSINMNGLGMGSTAAGSVVTRSFISPESDSGLDWLARKLLPLDSANTNAPTYNSMTTPLFLGLNAQNGGAANTFYLGKDSNSNQDGGTVMLQNGSIVDKNRPDSTSALTSPYAIDIEVGGTTYLSTSNANPIAYLVSNCTTGYPGGSAPANGTAEGTLDYYSDCQEALDVKGDAYIAGKSYAYTLWAGSFVYDSSDFRLKKDIKPVANALDNIMNLNPVTFTFKASQAKGIGFIAQDIEKIYPDLVAQNNDGYKAVNYDGLIAPLVSAVQELKHENDELRKEVHALQQNKLHDKAAQ